MGRQFLVFTAFSLVALAQNPPAQPVPGAQPAANQLPANFRTDYLLGPNDQILINVPQADDYNRPFRVDSEGYITLAPPLSGRIKAQGLTAPALEAELTTRLREFIREPQVSITLVVFRNDPVLFVGAFRNPGTYTLLGRKTLLEMLTTAGGLQPNASRRIKVKRRADSGPIPLPNAVANPEDKSTSVEVSLESLTQNVNPAEDIVLMAYDVISVERADRIFAGGEVGKVGPIELAERSSIPITQALIEAGGFTLNARRSKVRVLRPILTTNRLKEFEIDLNQVLRGKDINFPLLPNDILYVDRDGTKAVLLPVGTSLLGSLPFLIITTILR